MTVLHNPNIKSKHNDTTPSARPRNLSAVVSFPTALPPEQHRLEAARCQDGEDARLFKARLPGLVGHLHALGVRPVAELLIEHVGTDAQARDDLIILLEKYGRLSPAIVRAIGADTFPPVVFSVGST